MAAEHGVRIGLEPLNPVSLNQETAIWTLQQALDVIAEVDRDNVGICFDTWNLWQNPNLPEAIAAAGEQLFLLQVSDWRTPRSGADRRNVGTGEIPTGRPPHAGSDDGYLRLNRAAVEQAWQAG